MITNNDLRKYTVCPMIVRTGVEAEIKVIPNEGCLYFPDGAEYTVYILPMTGACEYNLDECKKTVVAKDGILTFTGFFDSEEEYQIRIHLSTLPDEKKKRLNLHIYALNGDLYDRFPLKGDFHMHSCRSDGSSDPAISAADYRRFGYDFVAVSDHNRLFGSLEMQEAYRDVELGMTLLNGEEVHAPKTKLHVLAAGIKTSVAELYVKHREKYEQEVAEIESKLPQDAFTYAMARTIWATGKIHEAGGIAIFPHPFWVESVYNVNVKLVKRLFEAGVFDAFEVIGGQEAAGNNLSSSLYSEFRAQGISIPVVGNSDAHGTLGNKWFREGYSIVFASGRNPQDILDAVRDGYSVAVESRPETEHKVERVYGDFRLVMFARFLVDYYFPFVDELKYTQGILMREYIRGVSGADKLIAAHTAHIKEFEDRSFGKLPAALPPSHYVDTVKKYNKVWSDYGVVKKGSAIE